MKKPDGTTDIVDRVARKLQDAFDIFGREIGRDIVGVPTQLPDETQVPGRYRAAGHARHALQLFQKTQLVEPDQSAGMEEHRPVAATGESKGYPFSQLARLRPVHLVGGLGRGHRQSARMAREQPRALG